MSEFSDLFNHCIKAKNIRVYSMTQYCGLDRSTMYKIIRGERLPSSSDLLQKIIEFLELTPTEAAALREAYQITSIGKITYRKRKNVLDFLLYFFEIQNSTPVFSSAKVVSELDETDKSPVLFLNGQNQINNMVHYVLTQEFQHSKGHIRLIVQPNYTFLFDILTSLGQAGPNRDRTEQLKVEHILCLDNSDAVMPGTDWDYNISCIKQMLPLHACLGGYCPYYYHDNTASHFSNLALMPYLILTSDCAIICSPDIQRGILFRSREGVSQFTSLFDEQLAAARPLTKMISDDSVDSTDLQEPNPNEPTYVLQAEPCIRSLIEKEHVDKYLSRQIPNREETAVVITQYLYNPEHPELLHNTVFTFTQEGILKFLKYGTVTELPPDFFTPFTPEDVHSLLEKMYDFTLAGHCRMLTGSFAQFPITAHVTISTSLLALLFPDFNGKLCLLDLQEPGLISSFCDFLQNAQAYGIMASAEDTAAFLRSVLDHDFL